MISSIVSPAKAGAQGRQVAVLPVLLDPGLRREDGN